MKIGKKRGKIGNFLQIKNVQIFNFCGGTFYIDRILLNMIIKTLWYGYKQIYISIFFLSFIPNSENSSSDGSKAQV